MIRPVGRKRENDPMKLFPYLFQFASPRLSDYKENGEATCDVDRGTPARLSLPAAPSSFGFDPIIDDRQYFGFELSSEPDGLEGVL